MTIILTKIINFIDNRKNDLIDKIESYLIIGILTIILFIILYMSSNLIPIYDIESFFYISIIFIYITFLIPFTIKFIYKTQKRRKEIKSMLTY